MAIIHAVPFLLNLLENIAEFSSLTGFTSSGIQLLPCAGVSIAIKVAREFATTQVAGRIRVKGTAISIAFAVCAQTITAHRKRRRVALAVQDPETVKGIGTVRVASTQRLTDTKLRVAAVLSVNTTITLRTVLILHTPQEALVMTIVVFRCFGVCKDATAHKRRGAVVRRSDV